MPGSVAITPQLGDWLVEHIDTEGVRLGAGYQAEVWRVASPQGVFAVKRPRRGLFAGVMARAAIRREFEAYRRLSGIAGIPTAHGLTRDDWLVLDFVAGNFLRAEQGKLRDADAFYASLLETIRAMHAAGVAHGDLKRKDNVIVGPEARPFVIDFGIARIRGRSWLDDRLFAAFRQLDLNAWVKLKHGRDPTDLPPEDAAIYKPLWLERIARWIRIPWQKLTLRRPRQRLRRWLTERHND